MSQTKLKEFFKEKIRKAEPDSVDWTAKRDAWLKSVDSLYTTIEKFVKGTGVKLARKDVPIWESFIGEYSVPELEILVGDERVLFSPKGVNVFGAQGRVDVFGDRGEATLVRQIPNRWSIIASRVPTIRLVPLTADTFADMLTGIMLS